MLKMKRFMAGLGVLAVMFSLLFPIQVYAEETQSNGTTTLTTKVPDTHTVLLKIGTHGCVSINEKTYDHKDKSIEIARLEEQEYIFQPEKGYVVESVSYGIKGNEQEIKITENRFTAPAIHSDGNILEVKFKKQTVSPGNNSDTTDKGENHGTGVKTGDRTNILGFSVLFLVSGIGLVLLSKKKYQKR